MLWPKQVNPGEHLGTPLGQWLSIDLPSVSFGKVLKHCWAPLSGTLAEWSKGLVRCQHSGHITKWFSCAARAKMLCSNSIRLRHHLSEKEMTDGSPWRVAKPVLEVKPFWFSLSSLLNGKLSWALLESSFSIFPWPLSPEHSKSHLVGGKKIQLGIGCEMSVHRGCSGEESNQWS